MAKHVLVVDDDEDFRAQMRVRLEAAGHEVAEAGNVADAKASIGRRRPDLAIVDLMMEAVDAGFGLCHYIKRTDASIPVVMITGVAHETGLSFHASTAEERSWLKADAVLDKPIRFEQLEAVMQRLLKSED